MKTIIAGSRGLTDFQAVVDAIIASEFCMSEIVSGCAAGVDTLGEQVAEDISIPVKKFPADWAQYGRAAGHIRNEQMAKYADALIAVWDGRSPGTKNMIKIAKQLKLKVYIHASNS